MIFRWCIRRRDPMPKPATLRRLRDDQRDWAERHQRAAFWAVKSWVRMLPSLADEFHEAALLGLCDAAYAFREDRGLQPSTLIRQCVKARCMAARKAANRDRRKIQLHIRAPVGFFSMAADPPPDPDLTEFIAALLNGLPERERDIVNRVIWEGEATNDIGESYGVTGQRIRQIYAGAVERMRGSLDQQAVMI